jgi:hypothetical protein
MDLMQEVPFFIRIEAPDNLTSFCRNSLTNGAIGQDLVGGNTSYTTCRVLKKIIPSIFAVFSQNLHY